MKRSLESGLTIEYTPNLFNKSRLELIKDSYRYLPVIYNHFINNLTIGDKAQ